VALEALWEPTKPLEEALEGSWRLEYTSASDVVGLLALNRFPKLPLPFAPPSDEGVTLADCGPIFQRFTRDGLVQNVTKLSIAPRVLLQPKDGVTLTVNASFRVVSSRRIKLVFEEAVVGDVRISEALEAVLAPALLPRGQAQMELLQALRSAELKVPLGRRSSASAGGAGTGGERPTTFDSPLPSNRDERGGASYQITYLDEDVFVGRAVGTAGSFIFLKEEVDGALDM